MVRWLPILLVALVLGVAAAGCGGGDDESSASGDTTTTETIAEDTTTDETTTDETTTEDVDTDFNWASEDCQSLVAAYVGLSAAIGAASGGQDVSGEIEEFADYVDKVPEEIRDDVETLAAAYGTFLDELKDLGLEPGQVPGADEIQALEDASKKLGDSDIQAASERLNAWTTANCS